MNGVIMKKIFVCIVIVALSVMFVNVSAVSAHREPVKRCTKFEKKFLEYGLTPVDTFSYIAWRESRCRIKAINIIYNADGSVKWALNKNGTFDSGILQINSSWKTVTRKVCGGGVDRLLILDCNLKVAKYLLDNGGLVHWGI
jgi:hypothetical protein